MTQPYLLRYKYKWNRYLYKRGDFMSEETTPDKPNKPNSSAITDIQRKFERDFCPDTPFGIPYIKSMAHTLSNVLVPFCVPHGSGLVLEKADLERIECLAVAAYLDEWLENDENATQTLHSFSTQKYVLKSERTPCGKVETKDDCLSRLRRAKDILVKMQELRVEQAELEGNGTKPLSESKEGSTEGIWYNFIILRFLDLYAQRSLTLFELLALRKEIMRVTSQKKSYAPLKEAYQNYSSIFKGIKSCENNREYVVSCIHIQKMEYTYRFQLCAEIAKYASSNGINIEEVFEILNSEEAKYVWGRYNSLRLLSSVHIMLNQPLDILNYKNEIECVFSADTDTVKKIILFRDVLANLIDIMNRLAVPRKQRSWEDKDFNDAAKFFQHEYPISECGIFPDGKSIEDFSDFECQCIQEIYNRLAGSPEMPLYSFRKEMQTARKERNSKKSKPNKTDSSI